MGNRNYGQICFRLFPTCAENTGHTGAFGTQQEEPRIDLPIITIPRFEDCCALEMCGVRSHLVTQHLHPQRDQGSVQFQ